MIYKNSWALVTGASAGIGEAFARSLAQKGANLVLTARRGDLLNQLASELKQEFAVETMTVEADLSKPEAAEEIVAAIEAAGHHVDILINNAGFGMPGQFQDSDWPAHRAFLELMVASYARLVHLVLPGMRQRGFGRIVNVASLAGLVPGSAGHTMYGASKAFLVSFSQSLAAENEESGVKISAVCPGFTYSEFHDVNGTRGLVRQLPGYMFMAAEPVVEGALRAVENRHVVYVPGAWNKFAAWLTTALPRPWAAKAVSRQSAKFRRQAGE